MQRLRTVTLLDVSAVAGHHAMPAALLLWTNFDVNSHKYDNIWDKCTFQHCRSKVNVTDAILGNNFVMVLGLFCELILKKTLQKC